MCPAVLLICPHRPRSPLSITGPDSMPVLMSAWAGPMAMAAAAAAWSAAVRSGSIIRSINGCWASKEISRGRRLFYWYAQLKALEASFDGPMAKHLSEKKAEIERIEEAVSHISFPLTFSDQLYNLRSHIEIVRRKIASHANTPEQMAAE